MLCRNHAEESEKKMHIFTGERKQAKKPKGASAWMPAKIWKPSVKKAGVVKSAIKNLERFHVKMGKSGYAPPCLNLL